MLVNAVDYLRILESGNFMNFIALVLHRTPDPKDNLSVVTTETLRLKVWNSPATHLSVAMWHFKSLYWDTPRHCAFYSCLPTISLQIPDITITLPSEGLKLHVPAAIRAEFKNPTSMTLRNGTFYLHGEGYLQDVKTAVP